MSVYPAGASTWIFSIVISWSDSDVAEPGSARSAVSGPHPVKVNRPAAMNAEAVVLLFIAFVVSSLLVGVAFLRSCCSSDSHCCSLNTVVVTVVDSATISVECDELVLIAETD